MTQWLRSHPTFILLASTVFSLLLSIGAPFPIGHALAQSKSPSTAFIVPLVVLGLLSYAFPMICVANALFQSFRRDNPDRIRFKLIILAYASVVLVFAGLFFSMSFFADHANAIGEYSYYHYWSPDPPVRDPGQVPSWFVEPRAFTGMHARLWSTLDDFIPHVILKGDPGIEAYRHEIAQRDYYEVVKFRPNATPSSYCGETAAEPIAAEMDEVLSFISEGLHREYEDPIEQVGYDSGEGGWQMRVTSTHELFVDLGFGNGPTGLFDDLVHAFTDCQWVQKDPHDDLPCDALRYSWEEFCEQVKHQTRFVFYKLKTRAEWERTSEPYEILESLGHIVSELELITTLPAGSVVVRARQHSSAKTYTTASELGTAPKERASQSRMSPAGIPMFYGAFDEVTSFREMHVADETRDTVTFGVFKTLRPLQVLDLSKLPEVPSMFDESRYHKRMPLIFMRGFERDATKPVTKDGMEHIEYVPTQIVAEHFRHVFRQADGTRLDGILYRSSRNAGGICVALFCPQDDCTDDLAATKKTLGLVTVNRKAVDAVF